MVSGFNECICFPPVVTVRNCSTILINIATVSEIININMYK